MKIAVVGCGALGSYYGAKLALAGHTVHFLLRSDYEAVAKAGVYIRSPEGSFRIHPLCARKPSEIGVADFVLIGLKTTANQVFPDLIPPLVGPATVVLTLQNGLGNEDQLARLVPPGQIIGGLAFVCLTRTEPGVVHHTDHGAIVIGEYRGAPTERTHRFADIFRSAGVSCSVTPNIAQAHWEKLIWNIPFNGLGVAAAAGYEAVSHGSTKAPGPFDPCLATDELLRDHRWAQLVRELMDEVVRAGRALGFNIAEELVDKNINRTQTMGPYKPSTVLDYERGLPIELESLFLEPLRQAEKAGANTPRLRALCNVLTALDKARPSASTT